MKTLSDLSSAEDAQRSKRAELAGYIQEAEQKKERPRGSGGRKQGAYSGHSKKCKDLPKGAGRAKGPGPAPPVAHGQAGQPGAERNIAMVKWLDEEGFATDYLRNKKWHEFDWKKTKQEEMDLIIGPLEDFFLSHTREELYSEALKRVISLVPVKNAESMLKDPQLVSRNFWVELEHPELNEQIVYPGPFVTMTATPLDLRWRALKMGEHNEEIYVKELGFSNEQIIVLKTAGVI
jgi:hypothetical protein